MLNIDNVIIYMLCEAILQVSIEMAWLVQV